MLDDGYNREEIYLSDSNEGIYLDRMMWHSMSDFKKDTVLLVLASDYYDEGDYIRSYSKFVQVASQKSLFAPIQAFIHNFTSSIRGILAW